MAFGRRYKGEQVNIWADLHNKKLAYRFNSTIERRKRTFRRWFWHLSDDSKLGLWIIGVVAIGPLVWLALDTIEGLFR